MRSNVRFAWLFGTICLTTAGALGAGACSSSSSTTVLPGETDSGNQTDGTTPGKDGATGPGTDSGGGGSDAGTGVDCGKIPSLHTPGSGPYCPFQTEDAGPDASSDCPASESCCQYQGATPTPDSVCATPAACPAQTGFPTFETQCDGPTQCPGTGATCCLYTSAAEADAGKTVSIPLDSADFPGCPLDYKAKYAGGTRCETGGTCAAGEIIMCNTNADCPSGKTCTAFATNAKNLGQCL